MKTSLISNSESSNHLDFILKCFEEADEVFIATAFLKMSGLTLLLPSIKKHIQSDKPISIIAGQNFGLTEPQALKELFVLFGQKLNATIQLDKAVDKAKVFHPKLFLFKNNNKAFIISGSANITKGGLVNNQEVSLFCETQPSSEEFKQAIEYFEFITNSENASTLNLMLIKRYEQFYEAQLKARVYQKVVPDKQEKEFSFDYKKLKQHLKKFRTAQSKVDFKQRERDYREAKVLLKEIANSARLTQSRFEDIIDALVGAAGQQALWKSGSLFRNRRKVYNCKNEFRALVRFIEDNQELPANKIFGRAKELIKEVEGAAVNYVTEILMTYQPTRFANLNRNPITVLDEEAGVYFKATSFSFNGSDYLEYCSLTQEIAQELELKNMLEVDSFFNEIYWEIKYK